MGEIISITEEIGDVKVGDTLLPGVFERLRVTGAVRMDEATVPGRSGSSKQPLGFDDQEVELHVRLTTDEQGGATQKLRQIAEVFQRQDRLARPFVYTITNTHLIARGIRQVVFAGLESEDSNADDTIAVVCKFVEHRPITLKAEQRRPKAPTQQAGAVLFDQFGQGYSVPTADVWTVQEYGFGDTPVEQVRHLVGKLTSGGKLLTYEAAGLNPAVDDALETGWVH